MDSGGESPTLALAVHVLIEGRDVFVSEVGQTRRLLARRIEQSPDGGVDAALAYLREQARTR
jgi:hypothetical protein